MHWLGYFSSLFIAVLFRLVVCMFDSKGVYIYKVYVMSYSILYKLKVHVFFLFFFFVSF